MPPAKTKPSAKPANDRFAQISERNPRSVLARFPGKPGERASRPPQKIPPKEFRLKRFPDPLISASYVVSLRRDRQSATPAKLISQFKIVRTNPPLGEGSHRMRWLVNCSSSSD